MLTINVNGNVVHISEVDTIPADNVTVQSDGFTGNLSTALENAQQAFAEIDGFEIGGGSGGQTGRFDLMAYDNVLVTFATIPLPTADKYYGSVKLSIYADSATNKATKISLIHYTASIIGGVLTYNYTDGVNADEYNNYSGLRISSQNFEMHLVGETIEFKMKFTKVGTDTLTNFYVDFAFDNMQNAEVVVGTGSVQTGKRTLTPSEIRALHTTPIELVAAQGANKAIRVIKADFIRHYLDAQCYADGNQIRIGYQGFLGHNLTVLGAEFITGIVTENRLFGKTADIEYNYGAPDIINIPIEVSVSDAFTNNDALDTLTIILTYQIIDLS